MELAEWNIRQTVDKMIEKETGLINEMMNRVDEKLKG